MISDQEMLRRMEQIYRDVVATTPLSDYYTGGDTKKAYTHGIHMVQAHTAPLMARRMVEVLRELMQPHLEWEARAQALLEQWAKMEVDEEHYWHPLTVPNEIDQRVLIDQTRAILAQPQEEKQHDSL